MTRHMSILIKQQFFFSGGNMRKTLFVTVIMTLLLPVYLMFSSVLVSIAIIRVIGFEKLRFYIVQCLCS